MDRGIKLAIFVACILSLGLGVVWDSVVDTVRADSTSKDEFGMGPDRASAIIGQTVDENDAPVEVRELSDEGQGEGAPIVDVDDTSHRLEPEPEPKPDGEWPDHIKPHLKEGKYVVQKNDSFWKIAHSSSRFKFLGKDSNDWMGANKGVKLKPGVLLNIPK